MNTTQVKGLISNKIAGVELEKLSRVHDLIIRLTIFDQTLFHGLKALLARSKTFLEKNITFSGVENLMRIVLEDSESRSIVTEVLMHSLKPERLVSQWEYRLNEAAALERSPVSSNERREKRNSSRPSINNKFYIPPNTARSDSMTNAKVPKLAAPFSGMPSPAPPVRPVPSSSRRRQTAGDKANGTRYYEVSYRNLTQAVVRMCEKGFSSDADQILIDRASSEITRGQ